MGPGGGRPGPMAGELELASKMLQIQSKRFYLDVKQNRRGRFLKIAEVAAGGRKSRLLMSLPVAVEFRDFLTEFGDVYASLGPPNPDNLPDDGRIKSEVMSKDNRRYYLDMKENNRGRFLRVSQSNVNGPRSVVVIPAQGIVEFRDALTKLLEEFDVHEDVSVAEPGLPEGRQFRVENKVFYFDIGQNNRGIFMRVSEVKSNFRSAITVPERSWRQFRDIFMEVCEKMEKLEGSGGDVTTPQPSEAARQAGVKPTNGQSEES